MKKNRFTLLQIAVHVGAWFPLAHLLFDYFTYDLSPNPIQDMEQRTGLAAVTLLILSLSCTPLNTVFGLREAIKRRRALGLYAFMYACIHMLIFVDLDYGLAWSLIGQTIVQKPYIIFGVTTLLLLIPLAVTSFQIWQIRLGKNWKRLHKAIYVIAPLAILHYALSKKGDIFHLQGDIVRPLIYGLVVLLLLLLRLPPVRKDFTSLRNYLPTFRLKPKRDITPHMETR